MPEYKEMYLKLFRATEEATKMLIAAQRECEEMYIDAPTAEVFIMPPADERTE